MNSINLSDLIKVLTTAVLISASIGKFEEFKRWALLSGIKAATYQDYPPTHFFPSSFKPHAARFRRK